MDFHFETYRIQCTHPFGISRSSHSYYDIIFIYLEFDGLLGRGEAAPSNRYNESTERILSVLDNLLKGQAGQSLQNLNVICGLDINDGLEFNNFYP